MEILLYWLGLVIIITAFNFSIRNDEEEQDVKEQKSLFDFERPNLWRRIALRWQFEWMHWPRDLQLGIRNLFRWFKIIWNDRDWDRSYLFKMMILKIRYMADLHEESQRYIGYENNVKWMRTTAELLERVDEEFYPGEYSDYYTIDMTTDSNPDERGFVEMHSTITSERFDEYLAQYPREVKKVKTKYPDNDFESVEGKKMLGFLVANQLHLKARRIAFTLLERHVEDWWD